MTAQAAPPAPERDASDSFGDFADAAAFRVQTSTRDSHDGSARDSFGAFEGGGDADGSDGDSFGAFSGGTGSADADGFAFGAAAPPPPRAVAAASPLAPKERATTPSSGGSETAGLMGIAPMD